jgi:hypothetical protein
VIGEITAFRIGRSYLIPLKEVHRLLDQAIPERH